MQRIVPLLDRNSLRIFSTLLQVCFSKTEELLPNAMKQKGELNFKEHYKALQFLCKQFSFSKRCCMVKSNLVVVFFICRYEIQVLRGTSYRTESQKHSSNCTTGCYKDLSAWASSPEYCLPLHQDPSMSKDTTFLH